MQQALPYRTWLPASGSGGGQPLKCDETAADGDVKDVADVEKLVAENAVIVFGRRGCCMCHVVKCLLLGHGVNPTVYAVDEGDEAAVTESLSRIMEADQTKDGRPQFPVVFVGGKLFGGLERVMATHITGELVPMLRKARALWL